MLSTGAKCPCEKHVEIAPVERLCDPGRGGRMGSVPGTVLDDSSRTLTLPRDYTQSLQMSIGIQNKVLSFSDSVSR